LEPEQRRPSASEPQRKKNKSKDNNFPKKEKAKTMNGVAHLERRAGSSPGKHEGESSFALCDRLDRARDNSQRQLPTDHDYAVPTREYQTDQSSLKSAPAAARSVLGKKQKQRQLQKQPHRFRKVDTVTPYQAKALNDRVADVLPVTRAQSERRLLPFWQDVIT
jgi:hypothetical protein